MFYPKSELYSWFSSICASKKTLEFSFFEKSGGEKTESTESLCRIAAEDIMLITILLCWSQNDRSFFPVVNYVCIICTQIMSAGCFLRSRWKVYGLFEVSEHNIQLLCSSLKEHFCLSQHSWSSRESFSSCETVGLQRLSLFFFAQSSWLLS